MEFPSVLCLTPSALLVIGLFKHQQKRTVHPPTPHLSMTDSNSPRLPESCLAAPLCPSPAATSRGGGHGAGAGMRAAGGPYAA
eukprot:1159144-Pelagomonas_calceolata.AAC.4